MVWSVILTMVIPFQIVPVFFTKWAVMIYSNGYHLRACHRYNLYYSVLVAAVVNFPVDWNHHTSRC